METDAHLQSLFYISSRVFSKGALPLGSLHRAPMKIDACLKSLPFITQGHQ
jgi:hypothetical protein